MRTGVSIVLVIATLIAMVSIPPSYYVAAETQPLSDPCYDSQGKPQPKEDWCLAKFKEDPASLSDPSQARGYIGDVLSTVINLMLIAGALGAFVMFIYGGFRYMTAQDDAGKTKQARDTMQYAAVGLVIMSMVYIFMLIYNSILPHS